MPLFFTLTLAFLPGCASHPENPAQGHYPNALSPDTPAPDGKFARLDPRQLDDSLTDDQLARMVLPLDQVPSTPLFAADPNRPDAPSPDDLVLPSPPPTEPASPPPHTPTALPEPNDSPQVRASLLAQKAYLRAKRLLTQARPRLALDQIAIGLAAEPNNAALYELLAKDYQMAGDNRSAAAAAQKAIQLDPDRLVPYQIIGQDALTAGQFLRAASLFRRALKSPHAAPDNPLTTFIHLRLAQALAELDYLAAAADQYQQAYRLLRQQAAYSHDDPSFNRLVRQAHLPLMTLAELRLRLGQIDLAAYALRQAAQLFGPDIDIPHAFITYLAASAQPLQIRYRRVLALSEYLFASETDRDDTLASFYQACQKMAKFDDYRNTIERWHRRTTDNLGLPLLAHRQYAHALLIAGDTHAAEKVLLQQLAQGRQIDLVHRDLGRLYTQLADAQRMLLHYGAYLQLDPDNTLDIADECTDAALRLENLNQTLADAQDDDVLTGEYGPCFLIGCLARRTSQNLLAQHYYQRTLELNPHMHHARTALIELLLQQKNYQQALDTINGADPNDTQMIRYAGRAYAGLDQLDRAAAAYHRLADAQPEDYLTYLDLADVLARRRAFPAAEQILLKVLASRAVVPDAYHALFVLYARWNAQTDLSDTFREHTEQRARRMLRQCLAASRQSPHDLLDDQNAPALADDQAPDPLTSRQIRPTLEDLAQEYPTGRVIGLMLTELYLDSDLTELATRRIEQTLQAHPRDDRVLTLAGRVYLAHNDLDRAVQLRRQLYDLHPDNPRFLTQTLASLRHAGRPQQAQDLLLHAAQQPDFLTAALDSSLPQEALRTFAASRDYLRALAFFQRWYDLTSLPPDDQPPADSPEPTQDQSDKPDQPDQPDQPTALPDKPDLPAPEDDEETPTDDALVTDRDPGPLALAQNLLWALTETGDYPHATLHAHSLHQRFRPKQDWASLYFARSLTVRGHYDQTLELLRNLLQIQPANHALRLQLLLTLLAADRADQALTHAQTWYEQEPDQTKNRSLYLFTLSHAQAHDQAVNLLQTLLENAPNDQKLRLALFNTFLDARRYDDADLLLAQLPDDQKNSSQWIGPQVTLDIAQDRSETTLSRLDRLDPSGASAQVQSLKAQILAAAGQVQHAADTLQTLLQTEPNNIELQIRYTSYLQLAGQNDLAIDTLEKLCSQYPHESLLQNNLAYALTESCRQLDHAGQLLQRSLSTDPLSGPTLDSTGWLYYKRVDFAQALTYLYQAAAAMVTPDPEVYDHLGDAFYRTGRLDLAQHAWTVALRQLNRRAALERFLVAVQQRVREKLEQLELKQNVDAAPTCGGP